jgi:hypothetical protein
MINIYIVASFNKNNNKQKNTKVFMITLIKLECLVFFDENLNMHNPIPFLFALPLFFWPSYAFI